MTFFQELNTLSQERPLSSHVAKGCAEGTSLRPEGANFSEGLAEGRLLIL